MRKTRILLKFFQISFLPRVPLKLNVADDATKCKTIDFSSQSVWLNGQNFLYEDQSEWPQLRISMTSNEDDFNEIKTDVVLLAVQPIEFPIPDISQFS